MLKAQIITSRLINSGRKADFLHSSGYAKVQEQRRARTTDADGAISANFMAHVSADDFATRKTLDSRRKYIQKYKNSRLVRGYYGPQRARTNEAQIKRGSVLEEKQTGARTSTGVTNTRRTSAIIKPNF